ncbi:MAG: histidine phosphatase family protein [bacterium]
MKKIYFVRHGQSEGNAGNIRQMTETPLTELGIKQSEFIADRIRTLSIEKIVSSTMFRAKQTTEIISKKVTAPIEYSDLFVERRRPSEQYGIPKDDPVSLNAERLIRENFAVNLEYHYSDEENFLDLKNRANRALQFLINLPEDNILVVIHGHFLKIIIAYAIFGENLTANECESFMRSFRMNNTGITLISYKEDNLSDPWNIETWNDVSHLEEL